jgi:hypothetical protein
MSLRCMLDGLLQVQRSLSEMLNEGFLNLLIPSLDLSVLFLQPTHFCLKLLHRAIFVTLALNSYPFKLSCKLVIFQSQLTHRILNKFSSFRLRNPISLQTDHLFFKFSFIIVFHVIHDLNRSPLLFFLLDDSFQFKDLLFHEAVFA